MTLIKKNTFPEVQIYASRTLMGQAAARRLSEAITVVLEKKDEVNIIFAAAPSQNEFLAALAEEHIDWGSVNAFHMDEYIQLPEEAPQRFGNFLKKALFDRFSFKAVYYIDGNADDPDGECERYAALLETHPADVVCMGIGENGHLAFNDPHVADFEDPLMVKIIELDLESRQQQVNDGCFSSLDAVPLKAMTLTIPALIKAEVINCVVPGPAKAQAVWNALNMPVGVGVPSTALRGHKGVVLFLDRDSSSYLHGT